MDEPDNISYEHWRAFQLRTNEHRVQMGHSLHISRCIGSEIVVYKRKIHLFVTLYYVIEWYWVSAYNMGNVFCSIANVWYRNRMSRTNYSAVKWVPAIIGHIVSNDAVAVSRPPPPPPRHRLLPRITSPEKPIDYTDLLSWLDIRFRSAVFHTLQKSRANQMPTDTK